jgi:hypothetical protein
LWSPGRQVGVEYVVYQLTTLGLPVNIYPGQTRFGRNILVGPLITIIVFNNQAVTKSCQRVFAGSLVSLEDRYFAEKSYLIPDGLLAENKHLDGSAAAEVQRASWPPKTSS